LRRKPVEVFFAHIMPVPSSSFVIWRLLLFCRRAMISRSSLRISISRNSTKRNWSISSSSLWRMLTKKYRTWRSVWTHGAELLHFIISRIFSVIKIVLSLYLSHATSTSRHLLALLSLLVRWNPITCVLQKGIIADGEALWISFSDSAKEGRGDVNGIERTSKSMRQWREDQKKKKETPEEK
jgi:hypothetical protein